MGEVNVTAGPSLRCFTINTGPVDLTQFAIEAGFFKSRWLHTRTSYPVLSIFLSLYVYSSNVISGREFTRIWCSICSTPLITCSLVPPLRWAPLIVGIGVFALLWLSYFPVCEGQNTCGGVEWAHSLIRFGLWYRELNTIEAWRGEFMWTVNRFRSGEWFATEFTRTESCASACSDDVYDWRSGERRITWDTNLPEPVKADREEYNPLCSPIRCTPDPYCDEELEIRTEKAIAGVPSYTYYTWAEFLVKSRNNYFGMRYEAEVEQREQECQLTCVHHTTPG
jgi:hypothetical protein